MPQQKNLEWIQLLRGVAALLMHGGLHYFSIAPTRLIFLRSLFLLPVNPHYPPYFGMTLLVGWTLVFGRHRGRPWSARLRLAAGARKAQASDAALAAG